MHNIDNFSMKYYENHTVTEYTRGFAGLRCDRSNVLFVNVPSITKSSSAHPVSKLSLYSYKPLQSLADGNFLRCLSAVVC